MRDSSPARADSSMTGMCARRLGPQRAQQAEAVEPGHHHVGDDQVRRLSRRQCSASRPLPHDLDVAASSQQPLQVPRMSALSSAEHQRAPARRR